jgi:hypothetical protein
VVNINDLKEFGFEETRHSQYKVTKDGYEVGCCMGGSYFMIYGPGISGWNPAGNTREVLETIQQAKDISNSVCIICKKSMKRLHPKEQVCRDCFASDAIKAVCNHPAYGGNMDSQAYCLDCGKDYYD